MKGIYTVVGLENFLCTRKAYHTRFFQTSLILKAGSLPFYNLVHYYDSIFQKLVLCQKVLMYLEVLFMNWAKNWKVLIWFKRKTKNFRDVQVFHFALYPSLEISEISLTPNYGTDYNSRFKKAIKINWAKN